MIDINTLVAGDTVEFTLAPGRYVADYDDDGGHVGGHWSIGGWEMDPDSGKEVWVEDDNPKRYTGVLISHPLTRNGKRKHYVKVRTRRETFEVPLAAIVAKVSV